MKRIIGITFMILSIASFVRAEMPSVYLIIQPPPPVYLTIVIQPENSLKLSWNPPTTNEDGTELTDLDGYILYRSIESGNYTYNVNVGNVTTYIMYSLTLGMNYCFAVTAYDTSGNESEYSTEKCKILIPKSTIKPIIRGDN